MKSSKKYVAIRQFLPEKLKNSSSHSLLTLHIGDLIELTKPVNEDWAFGRIFGSTECALFPLSYTRPIKNTIDEFELETINLTNLWWQQTKQKYASGASEKEIDNKLNLISNLTTPKCPKSLPIIMEDHCEQNFEMGLHLINEKNGRIMNVENYEFNDLVQIVKQKRVNLVAKKNSNLRALSSSDDTDIERVSSLLIRLNFTFSQQSTHIDNELIISFVDTTLLPCYESYRLSDLSNSTPIYILLEDFDHSLLHTLQIKIDFFLLQLQNLPGFFIDESQHEMQYYKGSISGSLIKSKKTFTKIIDLNIPNTPRTFLNGQLCLDCEMLVHGNKSSLGNELKQRRIKYHPLMALSTRSSTWTTSEKDSVYLTFDFINLPLIDTQVERLQLIMHVIDTHGNIVKDVFVGSIISNNLGLPIEKSLTSKSYLQYYLFGVKDQLKLHLEISLPKLLGRDIHLRLLFYNSGQDGLLIGNLPLAISFLRLIENDALIGIGSTDLLLHKVESNSILNSLKYLKLFGTKRDQKHHSSVDTEQTLPSIPIHISTLSTHFTHNPNVLGLLKCTEKTLIIRAIDQLSSISSDFAMFLPRFLPKLFEKLGTDSELDRKIFGFVNVLFKRAEYPMEYNLKRVLEKYIATLKNPRIYGPFFALLNSSIIPANTSSQEGTVFWIDTVRGSSNMTKIIVLSASSDPQLIHYRQSNVTTNFVYQHLNAKFTLLLNTLISNLCDKNAHFADHQWIHLKNIPNMANVLFDYDIFDAKSLCLFLIELIKAVPARMRIARVEIIRTITQLKLFKVDDVRRQYLIPEFIPIIVESLQSASTKPETKLLNSTVALLLNTFHLLRTKLHENGNKMISQELLSIVSPTLLPIIRCCNAGVYNGHEEIQLLSQTLFITIIDLIDAQLFSSYLEEFEEENQISYMLNEFLKALRPFTETSPIQVFNEEPIKLVIHRQCVKFFQFIKCSLFNQRIFTDFQIALWKELMHILHSFLMNSNEIINNLYANQANSLRIFAVECLRSMWFSLTVTQKLKLSRNMLESILDLLSSIQSHQLNSTLLAMFGDILKTEGYYYSEGVKSRPDQSFTVYKLLHSKLMKRPVSLTNRTSLCSEMEEELRSVVLCDQMFSCIKKLNMLPRFLKLINFGREALFRNNGFEIGLIYHKFLWFWHDIDEKEMVTEYILRLFTFYKSKNEFVEAAFSLQNYALRLNWTNNMDNSDLALLSKRLKLDTTNESVIKGPFPNSSIFIKSAARIRDYYQSIAKKLRLNCLYFLVCFYGKKQPEYLHNKKFVFRGKQVEMLDSFRQQIVQNFGCELLQSLDENPQKLATMDGKYATVASIQPIPSNEFERLSDSQNPLLSWFYKHNHINTFVMTRPMSRKESKWTEKFGLNDTTKFWIRRTEFKLNETLPGILPFREVFVENELEPLNPLQSACLTISNTNEELDLNSRLVDFGFSDTYLNTLVGQLRGIVQAFVGGGVKNYEAFLSNEVDEILLEESGSLDDKDRLKNLLIQQVKLLDYGLCVHGRHLNEGSRPLHDSLIDSFRVYHQKIQQLCGTECNIGLAREFSINSEMEPTGRRHSIKHLSRMSTESETRQLAIQKRSTSMNYSEGYNSIRLSGTSKQKLSRTDFPPPLPPRRSNRHSSKPLIPRE